MEKTNLWPRPLDDKNLTTEWIEEMFDCGGWMPTPYCKNRNNQYLTYIGETLVKVSWEFGKNQLAFIVVPDIEGCESYLKEKADKAIAELKRRMQKFESDENEFLAEDEQHTAIQYNELANRIDFFFYWESKD
jgi:hypothetical protein